MKGPALQLEGFQGGQPAKGACKALLWGSQKAQHEVLQIANERHHRQILRRKLKESQCLRVGKQPSENHAEGVPPRNALQVYGQQLQPG